jgi:hypothetical protein
LTTQSSEPSRLGAAFGLHRTMDTAGAALGPVVAFAVLTAAPGAYDAVFVVSLAVALVGLAILGLFVEDRRDRPERAVAGASARASGRRPREPALPCADRRGGTPGACDRQRCADLLLLQRRDTAGHALSIAVRGHRDGVSDFGTTRRTPGGSVGEAPGVPRRAGLVLGIYGLLLSAELTAVGIVACVALLGAYYAATDGVLAALAGSVLQKEHLTTGLASDPRHHHGIVAPLRLVSLRRPLELARSTEALLLCRAQQIERPSWTSGWWPADGGGEPRLFLPAVVLGDPELGSEQGTEAPKPSPAR